MSGSEQALVFRCGEADLVGVLRKPDVPCARGVVVVVGGPQYRVGSHRQFVMLARRLAQAGFPTLRFDARGMGDSSGEPRPFHDLDQDIEAAIDQLLRLCPGLRDVALWGLCDAASAIAMYAARGDARVRGVALFNPWVRSEASFAAVQVKHYYAARLLDRDVWRRLLRGRVDVASSLRDAGRTAARLLRGGSRDRDGAASFQTRMARGLQGFRHPVLVVLSENDLTAKEFALTAASDPDWRAALERPGVLRRDLPESDHTFSRREWQTRAEDWTLEWLASW